MQARRKQIRRRNATDSDESDDDGAQREHESAIAALKAKRQPVSKFKLHTVDVTDGGSEPSLPGESVKAIASSVDPLSTVERIPLGGGSKKPDGLRQHAPTREANALPKIRGVSTAYAQAESAMGFEPLPEFIPLDVNLRPRGTQLGKGRTKLEAMVYSSSDEDDETPAVASAVVPPPEYDDTNERASNLRAMREQTSAASRTAPASQNSAQGPTTMHDLLEKYSSMLQSCKEVLDRDVREQARVVQDLSSSQTTLAKFDVEVAKVVDEFEFFQSTRKWVRALCGFLTVKLGEIATIEAALDTAAAECSQLTACRQAADLRDEIAECEVRGDTKVCVVGPVPDMPPEIPADAASLPAGHVWRPEARLIKRRIRLAKAGTSSAAFTLQPSFDSLSECDESDSETQSAMQRRVDVLEASYDVMTDTLAEYSNAATVRDRFVKWKTDFPKSYEDAYISLSLHEVFSPFARLELLSWSPCHTVTLLNEFEWFQVVWPLVETGADMSDRLVPTVVSSVVIPRLCAFVRNGWDPFSRKQSKTLCDNINEVLTVEPSGDAIQELTQAVVDKLRLVTLNLCIPVFIRHDDSGLPSASSVTRRQFVRACKLLASLSIWNGLVSAGTLVMIGLTDIVNGLLVPVISALLVTPQYVSLCQQCMRSITAALPDAWTTLPEAQTELSSLKDLASALASVPTP